MRIESAAAGDVVVDGGGDPRPVVCWNMIFEFNIAHLGNIDAIREKQAAGYFLAARLLFDTLDSFCFLTFPTTSLPLQQEMCVVCGPQIEQIFSLGRRVQR